MDKKLIETIGNIKVYEVDGEEIRAKKEPNFTNFASHLNFDFVPENEFWVDHENDPGETWFFITRMLTRKRLVASGIDKDVAEDIAERTELAERYKSRKYTLAKNKNFPSNVLVQKNPIATIKNIKVYLVDGEIVRDLYYEDFTEGGHDLVYDWIPPNTIFIDDDVMKEERTDIILHEAYERMRMASGLKYEDAHKEALKVEGKVKSGKFK